MSQETVGVEADFTSREAAHAAKDRLVRAGFARNSIDIDREGDTYIVHLPTREANRQRAARILRGRAVIESAKSTGWAAADTLGSNRLLTLGLAALVGFTIYGMTNRR
ncbi:MULTISPECIES: hypothetical protein [Methylorubrum]|uniref:hypothetical protein n=1 Tax=Methylorubrum TaxID=2282523 RepID=UPI00209F76DE|nr:MULTISPECIES: hypothetical protein [Methylorubrum]MCP1549001.1 hypothetical protein [Methylorubrum zatmanii]MCP1554386.1 hypothetical protein [Methylorubrum extorquens]MCP1579303.1 hypothetical protein [Methylorubrum extorquens]